MPAGSMLDTIVDHQHHLSEVPLPGDRVLLEAKAHTEAIVATHNTKPIDAGASSSDTVRQLSRVGSGDNHGQGHDDQDPTAATETSRGLDQPAGAHEDGREHEQSAVTTGQSQEFENSISARTIGNSSEEARVEAKALALELERQIAQKEMDVAIQRAREREIEIAEAERHHGDTALDPVSASERMQRSYAEAESMR
jgi:hypothetical protein